MIEYEHVFTDYRNWLLKMATAYLPERPDEWADLAQEGHIAMWRAARMYDPSKGALPGYLTQAARWRMRDCAGRESWTGTIGTKGHVREKIAIPESALVPDESGLSVLDKLQAEAIGEGVMLAYHQGEIASVLSGFSQSVRTALYRKFWLDEIVPHGMWARAIPVLADRLEHLRADFR